MFSSQLCSYLLTGSEISYGLVLMSENTEHYHRSSNKRLFINLKNIYMTLIWFKELVFSEKDLDLDLPRARFHEILA